MDEQKNINAAALRNLELLNKQVAELLQVQRKAVSGYDYLNANELADLLGESIKTIYARVHNRQIPLFTSRVERFCFSNWTKYGSG
jgi:hypothetical protein